jgi:NDP-sugar pyrophosphorylase family protein
MKRLGRFLSKAALIAYDQPMLMRHLDHLLEAGFRRIIVSTNPLHYDMIEALVAAYRETLTQEGIADAHLTVLNNPAHLVGPTEGLAGALPAVQTRRVLLVLVDEFLRGNSFKVYAGHVEGEGEYGGISELMRAEETKRGGYVTVREGKIVSYVEQVGILAENGVPSTGNTLLTTDILRADVATFLSAQPASPSIGDFLEYRVQALGRTVYTVMESDFVNINTPDYLLLATLYAAMERHGTEWALYEEMAQLADRLRHALHAPL